MMRWWLLGLLAALALGALASRAGASGGAGRPLREMPACSPANEGMTGAVTDSQSYDWGTIVYGSGWRHVFAYCDGATWTVMAK